MLTVETHPDLEALAAFAEGRLEGREREQILRHLDSCEACFELLAETLHLSDEPGPGAGHGPLC